MTFTDTQITAWMTLYLWPFFRIAALVSIAPVFGTRTVPARVKIMVSVALTVLVAPLLPATVFIDPLSWPGLLTTFHQVLIGMVMGFMITLVFGALITGGQAIAQLMGLGFASMMDPQNGVQVPVVGQFYTILATLLFLGLNGHLVLINVLVSSFQALPVGPSGLSPEKLWQVVLWSRWLFIAAVTVALPAITALLLVNIAFGVMTRAAPQMNIFAVGFPVTILLGFVVMLVSLPWFIPRLQAMFDEVFDFISHTLLGGA